MYPNMDYYINEQFSTCSVQSSEKFHALLNSWGYRKFMPKKQMCYTCFSISIQMQFFFVVEAADHIFPFLHNDPPTRDKDDLLFTNYFAKTLVSLCLHIDGAALTDLSYFMKLTAVLE